MNGVTLDPIWLSLGVATVATLVAVVVGVPLAFLLSRWRFRFKGIIEVLVLLPMVLPPTVIGYYLLIMTGRDSVIGRVAESIFGSPIVFTPAAAVLATFVASSPFLVRAAQGGFEQVDHLFEDAARTLGRSEMAIFFTVSIPLAWRAVVAGIALCFARAMGEFGATLMLAGNIPGRTQTASMAVYDAVQSGDLRRAMIMSLVLSCTTGLALWLLTSVGRSPSSARPELR